VKRVALALCALLFAACEVDVATPSIDIDANFFPDGGGLSCDQNPCVNAGVCSVLPDGFHCACPPGYEGDLCELDVDDCEPNPCKNAGLCSDRVAGYTCACAPGFSGVDCSTNIDECAADPCQHAGTCTDKINSYQCDCSAGYTGSRCEVDVDDCADKPCDNEGTCEDKVNGFTCKCKTGNTGPTCSNTVERCAADTCQHGGTCAEVQNGFKCTCAAGYSGKNCETNIDDCGSTPCQHGGNCIDEVNGYTCECPHDYEGENCENLIDPCNPSPCQNDGECSSAGDFPVCSCKDGFHGDKCQSEVDECEGNPCKNGGTCEDEVDGYKCTCPTGFTGPTCNNEPPTCPTQNPCNDGVCKDGINGYSCDCNDGFIGAECEINVNDCMPNPCKNGSTCMDGDNAFTCMCLPGWDGPTCQHNIDACDSEPCQNGGECSDLETAGGYECDCKPGYAGTNCEEELDECDSDPCQNGGSCNDEVNGYTCTCLIGFEGDNCELDNCSMVNGPCGNGVCDRQGACICNTGWEGATCRTNIDECMRGTPCGAHGTCNNLTQGTYTCACDDGYDGDACDECAEGWQDQDQDPAGVCCPYGYEGATCTDCQATYVPAGTNNELCHQTCTSAPKACDHGTCDDSSGEPLCDCDTGYYGLLCDSFMGTCTAGVCGANGSCAMTGGNTYKCNCTGNYGGRNCETCKPGYLGATCTEEDNCYIARQQGGMPCGTHGTCVDGTGTYTCTCASGYDGAECDNLNECLPSNPCLNGGTCVDGNLSYTCNCPTGWTGNRCMSDVNDCSPNPCQHGGACTDTGTNTFTCNCSGTGWGGATCAADFDECTDPANPNICGVGNTCTNVAAGGGYSCRCADGKLDVNGDGKNCSSAVTIAAGGRTSCAISAAGSLHCWGDNVRGQLANGGAANPASTEVRTPTRIGTGVGWTKISVGALHACGVRSGHLYCWGDNIYRQLGISGDELQFKLMEPRPDLTWTDVAVGDNHTCGIAANALYCWGRTVEGQAGTSTGNTGTSTTPNNLAYVDAPKVLAAGSWKEVTAGGNHTCAINSTDQLYCWGPAGQVGGTQPVATQAEGAWSKVKAGSTHTCALAGTRAYCWGETTKGAIGNGSSGNAATPSAVSNSGDPYTSFGAGLEFHCGATAGGQLYCWGSNDSSLLLGSIASSVNTPQVNATVDAPTSSAYGIGATHMCAVDDGLISCWGSNTYGESGSAAPGATLTTPGVVKNAAVDNAGNTTCASSPCKNGGVCTDGSSGYSCDCTNTGFTGPTCAADRDECADNASICGQGTCANRLDGTGYTCKCADGLIDLDETGTQCVEVSKISIGVNHTCVITTSGTMHCWGSNKFGQYGLGYAGTTYAYPNENTQTVRTPKRIFSLTPTVPPPTTPYTNPIAGWTHVAVGENHTCGIRVPASGVGTELYCWGDATYGQSGYTVAALPASGTPPATLTVQPYLLDNSRIWVALGAGYAHTCGIVLSGEMFCWGFNKYGQIANGSVDALNPVIFDLGRPINPPVGSTSWTAVAPGNPHTCAITNTGSTYCWGRRNVGQTGGGTTGTPDITTPTIVSGSQGYSSIATEFAHSCGVIGTNAFCWGQGTSGGIGDGNLANRSVPTQVQPTPTVNFSSVALGSNFGCGMVPVPSTTPQGYSLYCWGNNPVATNMLLNSSLSNRNTPLQVTTQQWRFLDVGTSHICGVDNNDGKLYCWGNNGLDGTVGQGKVGSVPYSVTGTGIGVGLVKAAAAIHTR
jgi:alpha-tubulin suppressor-like RCC1 family protein